jgi:hypothetical protein
MNDPLPLVKPFEEHTLPYMFIDVPPPDENLEEIMVRLQARLKAVKAKLRDLEKVQRQISALEAEELSITRMLEVDVRV